jgi:hypothetical protein
MSRSKFVLPLLLVLLGLAVLLLPLTLTRAS